jgi:hypothetical protein
MESKTPVCEPFTRHLDMEECSIKEQFLFSYAGTPSMREDHTVQRLCTIKWHTRDLNAKLPLWHNSVGKAFRKLDYEIQMTTDGGAVGFSVHYADQKLGSQQISVEFS